ncbi:hypothetical protein EWI61_06125 [Methylolobus aquaticus]|nr:hypothetical protein EWI61_06125 [Methylolobus aquaticus]
MNTRDLRKTIAMLFTGSAVALASGAASAINVTDLGALSGVPSKIEVSDVAPIFAWDGFNNFFCPNDGWAHNSKWYMVTVPVNHTVQISVESGDPSLKPAFSVFKTTGDFNGADHTHHCYNQTGLSGESAFLTPQTPGGNGATAFVGYANAGDAGFSNYEGAKVGKGTFGKSGIVPGNTAAFADFLKKGQYLIVLGGSCNSNSCPLPEGVTRLPFKLTVQKAPVLSVQ